MKLENTYKIVLMHKLAKANGRLTQYIEADGVDSAIERAKNTFHARLYNGMENPNMGSSAQKACMVSNVTESLKFGFGSGWYTVHGDNKKTIFEMLKEAEGDKNFVAGAEIEEIYSMYVNGKRV